MSSDSSGNSCSRATRSVFSRSTICDVLLGPALTLVETARLEQLDVVDPRHRLGHQVAEVLVLGERDAALGDPLHAGRRVRDLQLLGTVVVVLAADATGVQQVRLDRMRREQLQDAIALQPVREREERVRPGDAQEDAGLGGAAGARARGLAEHEVRGGLLLRELGHGRDDVLVPVEDQQVVHRADLARVPVVQQVRHLEHRASVLRVALLEEVHVARVVLVRVLQVRRRLDDRAVDRRFEVGIERERLREAAVLGAVRVPAGHQPDEVVLHGLRAVLRRERRRGLAGARQADDHDDLLAARRSGSP